MWKSGPCALNFKWMSKEIGHKSTEGSLFTLCMDWWWWWWRLRFLWNPCEWSWSGKMILLILASCPTAVNTLRDRFIWFMINSCECGWSTAFLGEQPARIEAIPNGLKKIIVLVLNTRSVLANLSAHLGLHRVGYSTTAGHWFICSFSSAQLSHSI